MQFSIMISLEQRQINVHVHVYVYSIKGTVSQMTDWLRKSL